MYLLLSIDYHGYPYIRTATAYLINYLFGSTDVIPGLGSGAIESKPGSGMHFKYLRFLDICSQAELFRHERTRVVTLPSTFTIGRCSYHNLYVRLSHYFCGMILTFTFT